VDTEPISLFGHLAGIPVTPALGALVCVFFLFQLTPIYAAYRSGSPGHYAGCILLDTAENGLKKRCEIREALTTKSFR
jgi:hypothetical protein